LPDQLPNILRVRIVSTTNNKVNEWRFISIF
jgi:hypothetical protein